MKEKVLDFVRRGLIACGFGPIALAIIYLILQKSVDIKSLSVTEVCLGIFTLSALAFIVGGMNTIYKIEQLPLMSAILIHGSVLYISYLGAYLLNGWLDAGVIPVLVFSVIFVVGYLVIWAIIYLTIKRKTKQLNEMLKKKQQLGKNNE